MLEINNPLFSFDQLFSVTNFDQEKDNEFSVDRLEFIQNNDKIDLIPKKTNFVFNLKRQRFSDKKSVIIICSKDNSLVLKYCLDQIQHNNINQQHDILLVDDRSTSNEVLELSDKFNTSYLRIDNSDNTFNYSVINNIAAAYAKIYNKDILIFYNNDMWPKSSDTFSNIMQKHILNKADITGCKLIYPDKKQYEELGNPEHLLAEHMDKLYNTIQHGGIYFPIKKALFSDPNRIYYNKDIVLVPSHLWRFYNEENYLASNDSLCYSVTGALQIINASTFFKLSGFHPSLSMAFQDIDLCIRAVAQQLRVFYVGTESMYHAESLTNAKEKITTQSNFISDNLMWEYLWGVELPKILGYQKTFQVCSTS